MAVAGVRTVADVVQTTLGPFGANKLLIQQDGTVTATASATELLERFDVTDPAVTLLETAATGFGDRYGDGTRTVVTLAGALLREADRLTDQGLHPTAIERGYREGLDSALDAIDRTARPLSLCSAPKPSRRLRSRGRATSRFASPSQPRSPKSSTRWAWTRAIASASSHAPVARPQRRKSSVAWSSSEAPSSKPCPVHPGVTASQCSPPPSTSPRGESARRRHPARRLRRRFLLRTGKASQRSNRSVHRTAPDRHRRRLWHTRHGTGDQRARPDAKPRPKASSVYSGSIPTNCGRSPGPPMRPSSPRSTRSPSRRSAG